MSKPILTDELWAAIEPLLPVHVPSPNGGHPRVSDLAALTGIQPRIARRGVEGREHLGRWRWVVERTLGWLHRFRRLRIRYERRADIHQGFLSLACAIVCLRFVERYC